ncbi:DUF397 domain-containing protein [Streptomyces sp. NPDC015345]|uniref:DUF397 domain-containing protein n=1 Tax=Streptomyces sp. NPDC015345 TaxID=3364953 RepID=UPI0037027FAB
MRKQDLYAVELDGAEWHKSSFSLANGDCVEMASLPHGAVAVRDSKDPARGDLRFTKEEWAAFRAGAQAGEFG